MAERQLTLIDVDENPFVVRLKDDRIQLVVIDSRPELEASELRAFAAVLFAVYCGAPLIARLDAVRGRLVDVRDKLALAGASHDVVGALDGALCAIADARHDMTAPVSAVGSCTPDPAASSDVVALASRRRRPRGPRA